MPKSANVLTINRNLYQASPFRPASDMENNLLTAKAFAHAIMMMAEGLEEPHAFAINCVARALKDEIAAAEEKRLEIFHSTHPGKR